MPRVYSLDKVFGCESRSKASDETLASLEAQATLLRPSSNTGSFHLIHIGRAMYIYDEDQCASYQNLLKSLVQHFLSSLVHLHFGAISLYNL